MTSIINPLRAVFYKMLSSTKCFYFPSLQGTFLWILFSNIALLRNVLGALFLYAKCMIETLKMRLQENDLNQAPDKTLITFQFINKKAKSTSSFEYFECCLGFPSANI